MEAQRHTLKGIAASRRVWLNGKWLDPEPSQKVYNHSPDGFNWGYGGSGPSQLALAILLAITGRAGGYQNFKFRVIAALPIDEDFDIEFSLKEDEIQL